MTSRGTSSLTDLFRVPREAGGQKTRESEERHPDDVDVTTESSRLLPSNSAQPEVYEVPIEEEHDEDDGHSRTASVRATAIVESCRACVSVECLKSTVVGSLVFLLFHVVFCLAQASAITRPHATTMLVGPLAKMAALGILLASPVFVINLGQDIPAIYPTSDLFLAPFLANLAVTIDECLYQDNLSEDNELFLATFTLVSGAGLVLSGILCILAARFKLANLGAFLPFSVLCGFFSTIGILMWTLSFSVDTGGKKVGQVIRSGDWSLVVNCLLHHSPSLCIGIIMHILGPTHPLWVISLVMTSICVAYLVLWITGTSLAEAQAMGWFFSSKDLLSDANSSTKLGFVEWQPPAPFGIVNSIISGHIHWGAFQTCLPTVCALAFLYVIRSSLHAVALKKNIPNVTRKKAPVDEEHHRHPHDNISEQQHAAKPKSTPVSLQKILRCGYGYSQLMAAVSGGIGVAPAVAVALTLFKMGADGVAPQYGSFALLGIFYLTDFQLVRFIPKPAFSCLLVLAFLDMVSTWFIGSYRKTRHKYEWAVAPLIIVLTFSVGLLSAIFVGVAFSTIIFVGSFYRSGVVKYMANGLTLRSTIERGYRESVWLDQNGDLIQVLVLQNYLFFGNAQSLVSYISTMFDVSNEQSSLQNRDFDISLPPSPVFIIIDFTIVSGMDTSAIDLLREAITLCKNHRCKLFLSGMSQSLRSSLAYAGVKPDGTTFYFQPNLEAALGKAEDGILDSVFHVKELTEHDVGVRRRARALSNADDGFRFALDKIDEQHGLNYAPVLAKLEPYTRVVELKPGESLFQEEGGSLHEEDRGFFFIENGLMTVERNPNQASRTTLSMRTSFVLLGNNGGPLPHNNNIHRSDSTTSLGHLNARTATLGKEDERIKQLKRSERGFQRIEGGGLQNFRLARIGPGWVVGTIEGCSGMKNSGMHIAVTECRLHLLPFVSVEEIEKRDPALILNLFRLCSHLAARRQELTIEQLTQYLTIMSCSPSPSARHDRFRRRDHVVP